MKKAVSLKKLISLAVLLLLCSSSMSSADGVLAVQERFQEQSQWCWAGVSEAIFEYYGLIITQTQIAAYGTNGYNTWNYLYGFDSEPPYFRRGINMILSNWGLSSTYGNYTMTLEAVRDQIDSARPFVIRWGWYTGGGHFVVGRGIQNDYIYYMDPWPGEGYNTALYSWVVDDGVHEWTHSLELTTPNYPCGDCNGDGRVTVADATYMVGYIYRDGPAPIGEADVNVDNRVTVADATYIVGYIYRGGPLPCAPPR